MKKTPIGNIHRFFLDEQKSALIKTLFIPKLNTKAVMIGIHPRLFSAPEIASAFSPEAPSLDFSSSKTLFVPKMLIEKMDKLGTQPVSSDEYSLNIRSMGGWIFQGDEMLHPQTSNDKNIQIYALHGALIALWKIREAAGYPRNALSGGIPDSFIESLYKAKDLEIVRAAILRSGGTLSP